MKAFTKKIMSLMTLICALSIALSTAVYVRADDEPKYSDEELYAIYDEIIADYMSDYDAIPVVMAVAVGAAMIDGEVTGFGPSGNEKRVVVSVRYQFYEEYKALLEKKYGDAVYVDYTPDSRESAESPEINFEDLPTDEEQEKPGDEATEERVTGTNAATQIIVGVVLVAAAVGIFFMVRKKK